MPKKKPVDKDLSTLLPGVSFETFYQPRPGDARVAGYVGFSDIGQMRRWLCSYPFLEAHMRVANIQLSNTKWGQSFSILEEELKKSPADLLIPIFLSQGLNFSNAQELAIPTIESNPTHSLKLARAMAYVLTAVDLISNMADKRSLQHRQDSVAAAYSEQMLSSGYKIPHLDLNDLQPFSFTTHEASRLEAWNRLWAMIRLLKNHGMTGRGRDPKGLFNEDYHNPFHRRLVSRSYVPGWMRSDLSDTGVDSRRGVSLDATIGKIKTQNKEQPSPYLTLRFNAMMGSQNIKDALKTTRLADSHQLTKAVFWQFKSENVPNWTQFQDTIIKCFGLSSFPVLGRLQVTAMKIYLNKTPELCVDVFESRWESFREVLGICDCTIQFGCRSLVDGEDQFLSEGSSGIFEKLEMRISSEDRSVE